MPGPGNDTLIAGTGDSQLYAGDGNSVLIGGPAVQQPNGQFVIGAGGGRDLLYADGSGNDLMIAAPGAWARRWRAVPATIPWSAATG